MSYLFFPVHYRVNVLPLKHWQLCSCLRPGLSTFCWSTHNPVMWQILSQWGKRLSLSITLSLSPPPSMVWTSVRKRDCIHSQVDSPSPDSGEGLCLVIFCYHYQCSMLCLSIWCWTSVFPQLGMSMEIIFSLLTLDLQDSWMHYLKIFRKYFMHYDHTFPVKACRQVFYPLINCTSIV